MILEVENLTEFLKRSRVSEEPYNFVSLRGGKFNITHANRREFLELYCEAAPHFNEQVAPSLVWKTPNYEHLPLIFDIALHLAEDHTFPNETFIELARIIMYHVSSELKDLCVKTENGPSVFQSSSYGVMEGATILFHPAHPRLLPPRRATRPFVIPS